MKERKHIDRIYQEKFKDFEKEPNEEVWKNISSRLDKKEKKRPLIIPLWWKIGSVAAVLAIILSSLLFFDTEAPLTGKPEVVFENPENNNQEENSLNTPKLESKKDTTSGAIVLENTEEEGREISNLDNQSRKNSRMAESNKKVETNSGNTQPHVSNQENKNAIAVKQQNVSPSKNEKEKTAIQLEVIESKTSGVIAKLEEPVIDTTKTKSLLEEQNALAEIEKDKEKTEDEEENLAEANAKRLRLSTFAAPVIYKNMGTGNELSNQLSDNASSSEVTLSYGVKVAYQISKKLRIRTGISKIDINKNVEDILYSPSARSVGFENINPTQDNIEIRNNNNSPLPAGTSTTPLPGFTGDNNTSLTTSVATPGKINQQFGYIEIPVELEFALIDKKFGLNIIGGGSSLFLDNNRIDLISGDNRTTLGEASNINSTSFSTNIGLGMDYKLTDKFSISVEPIFKYQLNTFDNVNNVQPVNFGVYSGLNFRF